MKSDCPHAPPAGLRRWLQFRVVTLLAWTAALAAALGFVVAPIFRVHRGRALIAALKAEGADVQFDYQFDERGRFDANAPRPDRTAWQLWLGEDESRRILRICLPPASEDELRRLAEASDSYSSETDSALARIKPQLAALDHPFRLDLSKSSVTRQGLRELVGVHRLESLDLGNTQLNDRDLRALAELKSLRDLTLPATTGDEGLSHVAGLTRLRRLVRRRPELLSDYDDPAAERFQQIRDGQWLTDAGLAHLERLTELEELDLNFARVSDAALPALAKLTRLQVLDLSHTEVTDAGLARLEPLENLRSLDLSETRVLGDGLASLAKLPQLRALDLADCRPSLDPSHVRARRGVAAYEAERRGAVNNALALLIALSQLEELRLNALPIYDETCACLAELPHLERLDLSRTPLTAAGLEYLQTAPELRELWVNDTELDDDDVKAIKSLPRLKRLHAAETRIDYDRFAGSRIEPVEDDSDELPREW